MYFLIINGLVRLYYAFFGRKKDYKEFVMNKQDAKNFIPQLKYYLFMGKHPKTGKYNPMQKLAYLALPAMTLVQIATGFILYRPARFAWAMDAFGGLAAVRGMHYVIMWLFFAIILVHVYLVFTESRSHIWMMFLGKNKEEKKQVKQLNKAA
jgi:Ni/Fe-hydrogenase 1 B-type cytochrome subunit